MKILLTCPPMLKRAQLFDGQFKKLGWQVHIPEFVQTVPEKQLIEMVPKFDGWIIGDDPATAAVFSAGVKGQLKAAVKWGVGVDNVDFVAAKQCGLRIENTPGVFGNEVADVGMGYVVMLARQLHVIDQKVRKGEWYKPAGRSLTGKVLGLVGCGDIGKSVARRAQAFGMQVIGYDPGVDPQCAPIKELGIRVENWPHAIGEVDYLLFTCSLNPKNRHMLNADVLGKTKKGVSVINVARGPLIDEQALIKALKSGHIGGAALDVFETEPLPVDSPLRSMENVVLGSHNGSNTEEAVDRVSHLAIQKLATFLGQSV